MRPDPRERSTPRNSLRLRRLDSLCDQFEAEWQSGSAPALDSFLRQVPPDDRPTLLEELLLLDMAYRRQRGAELTAAGYARMCPEFGSLVADFLQERVAAAETLSRSDTEVFGAEPARALEKLSFGDYDFMEEIGRGGMGIVYKAYQRSLDRVVAIKTILAGPFATPQSIQRFVSEARLAATLHHPGIVPIYEIGEREGLPYFTMEYVEGKSLNEFVATEKSTPARMAELVAQVAEIVHFAHERGVLHRDLKPSNVIVGAGGRVRVMDFGLAKRMEESATPRTLAGDVLGTPSFMSPEQARGDGARVDRRSDIYSLGAILYSLLVGRPPHEHSSPILTIVSVLQDAPVPPRSLRPDLDEDLERICLKCLAKDPNARYPTVDRFQQALEAWRRAPGEFVVKRRATQRRKRLAAAAIGAGVAVVAGWAIFVAFADPEAPVSPAASISSDSPDEPAPVAAPASSSATVLPRSRRESRPGDLDESFGRQGVVQLPLGTAEGINDAYAIALQPDGKIVAAGQVTRMRGSHYMAVTRFQPDGTLDRSFNGTGKLLLWFGPFDDGVTGRSLVLQSDGKIVFGGRAEVRSLGYDFGIARLMPDGTLDPSFGRKGLAAFNVGGTGTSDLQALALQGDGKIVAAGSTSVAQGQHAYSIARFLPDGAVDLQFGDQGKTFVDFPGSFEEVTDLGVRQDGRIVVVGRAAGAGVTDVAVIRLLADGSCDETFNGSGRLLLDYGEHETANYLVLQDDKTVVHVSGQPNRVVRLLADGKLDEQFGDRDGQVILDFASTGFAPDAAGNLLAVDPRFARLVMLSRDGKLLASYGAQDERILAEKVILRDMVRAPDGKLLLAGAVRNELSSEWTVVRVQGPPPRSP